MSRVKGRGFHVEGNFFFSIFFYKKMESIFLSRVEGRGFHVEVNFFFNFSFIKKWSLSFCRGSRVEGSMSRVIFFQFFLL